MCWNPSQGLRWRVEFVKHSGKAKSGLAAGRAGTQLDDDGDDDDGNQVDGDKLAEEKPE